MVKVFIAFLICALLVIAGCGKKAETTKDQMSAEKTATEKSVRENAVWGEPVKTLDKAKDTQKSLDAAAAESAKKIDELTK